MNQSEMIYKYNNTHRPKFNKNLFIRHDDNIINALKDVIMSCERDSTFKIKVLGFEVIDNYDEINHILWEYEDSIINKKKKPTKPGEPVKPTKKTASARKKDLNQFEYINLNDSDIKLLRVTYYIELVEKQNGLVGDTVVSYIAIPRIINNFYFRLNGNIKSAMYQIVDASTYNNSAALNAKKQTITFKTIFTPIRTYRYSGVLKNIDGESVKCVYFLGNMFRKTILLMKYIFAKKGYYETLNFFQVPDIWIMEESEIEHISTEDNYIFGANREIFIVIPKFIFDNSPIAQSLVYTIHNTISHFKNIPYQDLFSVRTWLYALEAEFTSEVMNDSFIKAHSVIDSLEMVYDIGTKKDLKLSEEDKGDIYRVLRWIMYEFNSLRAKDNLDISTKKIDYARYISSYYAIKISTGIYRISDKGAGASLQDLRKVLQIPPMYLIKAISSRCQLVNYKNCVNDLDSLTQLKFTYKGVSGIGEKSNAIPGAYRSIHPSHLGRVDIDSSSATDPGISGTICPLTSLSGNHFTEFQEPDKWHENVETMLEQYRSMNHKIELARLIKNEKLSTKQVQDTEMLQECASFNRTLINKCMEDFDYEEIIHGYDIFGDGIMFVTMEDEDAEQV